MIITMGSMRETICKNFNRLWGEHSDMGATELAKEIGVHRSMIYKWSDGTNIPEPPNITALARVFKIDPAKFYEGAENVIPMYGNSSIRKAMVIPDDVIEGLYELAGDEKIWEQVKAAILLRKKALRDAVKTQAKG